MNDLNCDCGRPEGQHTKLDCGVLLPKLENIAVKNKNISTQAYAATEIIVGECLISCPINKGRIARLIQNEIDKAYKRGVQNKLARRPV